MKRALDHALVRPFAAALPWTLLGATFLLFAGVEVAHARPGGGHGFSGGGHGPSGGGGGDIGPLIQFLLWLLIRHPALGVPVLILVLVYLARSAREHRSLATWTSTDSPPPPRKGAANLQDLRRIDPDFSVALFDDFVALLHARAHVARSDARSLAALSPWISETARHQLARRAPQGARVVQVVIGDAHAVSVHCPGEASLPGAPPPLPGQGFPIVGNDAGHRGGAADRARVVVRFEANISCLVDGREQNACVTERWTFERAANARTPPPERVRSFACPSCGAREGEFAEGRCGACGTSLGQGEFDWLVTDIEVLRIAPVPPLLTGTVEEENTHGPTVTEPGLAARFAELTMADDTVTLASLERRVRQIHGALNRGWTARDLEPCRPLLSAALHSRLEGQLSEYRRQGLANAVEGGLVTRVQLTGLDRDRWHDAATFRVWATGRDVTREAATGRVVGGDASRNRPYSEHWTLLRRTRAGLPANADTACPACGAPLPAGMATTCSHCGSHASRSTFDWVLSRIAQD